jgi:hypothetical protein
MCENGNCIEVVLKFVMQLAWCYSMHMLSYVLYFTLQWVMCLWPTSKPSFLHVSSSYSHSSHHLQQPQPFSEPLFSKQHTFISYTLLSCPLLVSDLNAGCMAVTSSCTSLLTLLLFTATSTHLHPSGCKYCYLYANMLPLSSCIVCSSWTDYTLQWR